MISAKEKKYIVKSLGSKHISKISTYCRDNKVLKEDGSEYSKSMLSMVLNGANSKVNHSKLEKAIFSAAAHHLEIKAKEDQNRENFLCKVKSTVNQNS